ncbi:MAG TPA: polysaccharide deacetylase family protein [Anaerolineales bacterium]|nr:polysaccharide deacetylase family protein [Anaerolineales bacterium]
MNPNPYLKKLGYDNNDRLVIIHTDDIGMCQASVQAFRDLWSVGGVTSGAVMVPCPWFPATAQMCRENPDMDMGVHATLNAEWSNYRWAPVSDVGAGSGLRDEAGYFHDDPDNTSKLASVEDVEKEVHAQIEKALQAGIDVTHVDSHMGAIMHPKFIQTYIQAAGGKALPNMLPRLDAMGIEVMGISDADRVAYAPIMEMLEGIGVPTLNGIMSMPLDQPDGQMEIAKTLLGNLPEGITHFILHPSIDTPELHAIAPDWESRVSNYNTFMSDELKKFIESEDIKPIGYRAIRDAMRK